MQNKIYPCLWFDGKAKEAAEFYCSVFHGFFITAENPFVVIVESATQKFMLLNGGAQFHINPSISFFAVCETDAEIEDTWDKLLVGGTEMMPLDKYDWSAKYGWVQDKYGVNWQLSYGKIKDVGQKFSPVLMFTGNQSGLAEKAIEYYTSVFENSDIDSIMRYAPGEPDKEENIKHAQFRLVNQVFMAMDSSLPHKFTFNEGVSFVVNCETQAEIDYYWKELSAVPEAERCGWLKDKFGVSWQIVPTVLEALMSETEKSQRVMNAFMKMKKFDIETLVNA
jgi:predicted 3-demethylubiquinone-9 3-methyltransferase (glyoxalase superfamily)